LICAFTTAAALMTASVSAQQSGATAAQPAGTQPPRTQTALANDAGILSDKFVGLARVMAGKYDWRPAQNVRSVGDVFNLIVTENKMLSGLLTGAQAQGGGGGRGNQVTDPAAMQEALRSSYTALKEALEGLSDSDLRTSVTIFGRETTKLGAAYIVITDQHEHLGQSIAYARSNNVVPPWSK
jgi:hypothetical protein